VGCFPKTNPENLVPQFWYFIIHHKRITASDILNLQMLSTGEIQHYEPNIQQNTFFPSERSFTPPSSCIYFTLSKSCFCISKFFFTGQNP